jgi:lysophospholipase L1-like esterase
MLYFPEQGVTLGKNVELKFPTFEEFFLDENEEYADISDILDQSEELGDSSIIIELEPEEIGFDTIRANAGDLKKKIHYIEFAENDKKNLHKFFKTLHNLKNSNELIRIMHYGDSQIEGDRMTSFIRNKMQKQFGGSGPGLLSAVQPYNFQYSIKQTNNGDWHRYTLNGGRDTTILHSRYGALSSFSQFTPHDKNIDDDTSKINASIIFEEAIQSYPSVRNFNQCRIFWGYNKAPVYYETFIENELHDADVIPPNQSLNVVKWTFDQPVKNIRFNFNGIHSPEFYGIALDNTSGVAVDNIALRGSSGLIFNKIERDLLHSMYSELNVKLLILQFGGNVVSYMNKSHYKRYFLKQLNHLKTIVPDIPIIVIGVSDMSVKEKQRYVTRPNLENIRDALKEASFEAGHMYWDMYEAMGGKNSMPSWVFAEPALASTDFVHFNYRGARIIAEMFYNALIYEYNLYVKENLTAENAEVKIKTEDG